MIEENRLTENGGSNFQKPKLFQFSAPICCQPHKLYPNMNQSETAPQETAWAHFGEPGEDENMLVGNREGLTILRDAIDHAIEHGEGMITTEDVEFAGVRALATKPPAPVDKWSKFFGFGCLILAVVCSLIFLVGLARIASLIFE